MSAELIAKLESASEGSRELDARVEVAVRDVFAARSGLAREHWARWEAVSDGYVQDPHTRYASNPVTTSIDAALALAERVGRDPSEVLRSAWSEVVRKYALHQRPFDGASYTQAIALAICAALLRASAAEGAGE